MYNPLTGKGSYQLSHMFKVYNVDYDPSTVTVSNVDGSPIDSNLAESLKSQIRSIHGNVMIEVK